MNNDRDVKRDVKFVNGFAIAQIQQQIKIQIQ